MGQYLMGATLVRACEKGDIELAQKLLDRGAPVDWKDDEGWAPLHKACLEGNTDIVKLLIKHKANLNLRDGNGDTPLCVAAYVGFMGIVHALVEAGADITIYGDKHKTAAEQATEWKHELVANYLTTEAPRVQAGDADAIERAKKWWQGWPLYDACKKGNAMEAKRLIKEGAPIGWRGPNGWTPLHMASANDKKDVVVLLIESKADLDVADSVGNTPLIWATCDNHIQIVITLVQAGADTTVRGERNRTAAELAKVRKYDAVFQYLTTDAPLVQAQLKARVDTKKWKVSGQVLFDEVDPRRRTTVAHVKKLLDWGAPINWRDEDGKTPLHMASAYGKTDIVRLFIERKADLNIIDDWGNVPLTKAAENNHMEIVRALVEARADVTKRGSDDETAAEKAKNAGNDSIAEYLTTKMLENSRKEQKAKQRRDKMELKRQQSLQKERKLASEQHSDIMLYLSINVCVASALIGWACYSR